MFNLNQFAAVYLLFDIHEYQIQVVTYYLVK